MSTEKLGLQWDRTNMLTEKERPFFCSDAKRYPFWRRKKYRRSRRRGVWRPGGPERLLSCSKAPRQDCLGFKCKSLREDNTWQDCSVPFRSGWRTQRAQQTPNIPYDRPRSKVLVEIETQRIRGFFERKWQRVYHVPFIGVREKEG